jgi:ankyrin repeat protein
MAAYMGDLKFLRYLLSRQLILIHEKTDEGKTPILLAIEAGNVFNDENACTVLLERGTDLEDDVWHKLLILSLNYDLVAYPRLAYRQSLNLHNPKDETKISLHKAVCCLSVKILKFYADNYPPSEIRKMIEEPDFQGLSALDYARLTERPEILDMVEKMRDGVKVEVPSKKGEEQEQTIQIN